MPNYYKIETQKVYTGDEIRKEKYPMTIPSVLSKSVLDHLGFVELVEGVRPETTVIQKVAVVGATETGDTWTETYKVEDKYSGADKAKAEASALAVEQKRLNKEKALADLQNEDIGTITTIKALKDRITNLEKYLGI